jgi:hypothetical protein
MSKSRIKVMISSRCTDFFPLGAKTGATLSEIRKTIKKEIESQKLFGQSLFDVWINEDTSSQPGSNNSLDVCLAEVKDCDILLVLYNGNAGWLTKKEEAGGVGICHAELLQGNAQTPGKLFLIDISERKSPNYPKRKADKRFQEFVETQNWFRGADTKTEKDLQDRCLDGLHKMVTHLTRLGVREATKGKYDRGQALDWSRLDFGARRAEMTKTVCDSLKARNKAVTVGANTIIEISGEQVLIVVDAIPAAMTVTAAKEMVGQPFLRDHLLAKDLGRKTSGPIHLIACHKSATEAQATRLLGFPDATLVTGPFGVFIADSIQKIQIALITNCRDESNTRYGIQRFFQWLEETQEADFVAKRAASRAKIVSAIATEAT